MGKASKFFKSLLGFKTTDSPPSGSEPNKQLKRRWSFGKSHPPRHRNTSKSLDGNSHPHNHHHHHHHHHHNNYNRNENEDPLKHAIALAAATAAVVDAAVATAQAAAEVVRMTGRTTAVYGVLGELAAIKIQSYFRAYLARRALRALKALVKLQAVVRGHILRKQTAHMMRRLQALIRAQARARAFKSQIAESTADLSSHCHVHQHRNNLKSYARHQERTFLENSTDHDHAHDKIVEVDTGRRFFQPDQISFGYSQSVTTSRGSTLFQPTSSSPCASCEVNSYDDSVKGGVFTPIKSDGSSCYSNHPNYMANTESSRAKVRSLSAPRLRSQLEVSSATKRDTGYKYGSGMVPTMRESYVKKCCPGSGRLDRLGMPVYDRMESDFCVNYWN